MRIADVLKRKGKEVKAVAHDARLRAAMTLMHEARIGSAIVLGESGQAPIGIVSQDELLAAFARVGSAALDAPVTSVMSQPLYCTCDALHDPVLAQMTSTRKRHAVVIGQDSELLGIVSIGDLVAARVSELTTESAVLRDIARSRLLAV